MRQKLVTWTDSEGYECSKWVPMTREDEIAADVAESLARQEKLIFGYTWQQIQDKQRGNK